MQIRNEVPMAVGPGRRIVVELDPELKQRLHERLRSDGRDLKGWLVERVQEYLAPSARAEQAAVELSEPEKRVLGALSADRRRRHHFDEVVGTTGLGAGEVRNALFGLELKGVVAQELGLYRRR